MKTGKFYPKIIICFQETYFPEGDLGVRVVKNIDDYDNIIYTCSKSGNITKSRVLVNTINFSMF